MVFRYLKRKRKFLAIGALVGLVVTIFFEQLGGDLSFAVSAPGVIDNFIGTGTSLVSIAQTKVGIAMVIIGMTLAVLIDEVVR